MKKIFHSKIKSPLPNHNRIIKMAEDYSYKLTAKYFGISRNTVAGIIFRHKNPKRIAKSPNARGNNKLGNGYHGGGKYSHKIY